MDDQRLVIRRATNGDLDVVRARLASVQLPIDGLDEQFGEGYANAASDGVRLLPPFRLCTRSARGRHSCTAGVT
ncbi:MAG: hypothetical protein ABI910_08140 [Gemmatimonadota bacterium]